MIKSSRCPSVEPNLFETLKRLARKHRGEPLGVKWKDCISWHDLDEDQKELICGALSTYEMFQ